MKTTLYKKPAKGKPRIWYIWNEDNCIFIEHGVIGGAMQEEIILIEEAHQNRTIDEQVELRMNRRIDGKRRSGYVDSLDKINESHKNTLGFVRPMLAQKYKEAMELEGPVFVQRKYDGHRCLATRGEDDIVTYSRGGKLITSVSHIREELRSLNANENTDGELYIHGLKLQQIGSLVRKENITAHGIKYVIYDMVMEGIPFQERLHEAYLRYGDKENIIIAETFEVHTHEQIERLFSQFRFEGYEGAIIRHGTQGYECGKRSKYLLKLKSTDDDEFKVIGVTKSVEGWAILHCRASNGEVFKVSAPGTHKEKLEVLKNLENYVGLHVRVEFAGYTLKGKPSQPIATMWLNPEDK